METVLLYIVGILVVVIGLVVSIALHELGHFIPAKLFGVRVSQFMIGFGSTIFSWRKGDTEYGFKWIPLGGYVAMSGMFPPAKPGGRPREASTGFFQSMTDNYRSMIDDYRVVNAKTIVEGEEHRTFYSLPIYKRIIIMLGGPFMNLVIAVVLFAIVLCGFGIQQPSTTVGAVSECLLPATSEQTECASSDTVAPGAAAGVLPGDRLVSINGEAVETWTASTAIIQQSAGRPLSLVVDRGGNELTLTLTPAPTERFVFDDAGKIVEDAAGTPQTHVVGMIGITAAYESVPQPLTAVLPAVWDNIVAVGNIILNLPQRMIDIANAAFGSEERDPNGPLSVVGVGRIAGEITSINTIPIADRVSYLIGLVGSVNVALLVFNLIPLMPLDGGHVAGALWGGIRRFFAKLFGRKDPGPVDTAKLIPLTLTVIVLLGAMSLLLIYADIVKPISIL